MASYNLHLFSFYMSLNTSRSLSTRGKFDLRSFSQSNQQTLTNEMPLRVLLQCIFFLLTMCWYVLTAYRLSMALSHQWKYVKVGWVRVFRRFVRGLLNLCVSDLGQHNFAWASRTAAVSANGRSARLLPQYDFELQQRQLVPVWFFCQEK